MWPVALLLFTGLLPTIQAENEATRCADQPGYKAQEFLAGEVAYSKILANHLDVVPIKAWNASAPIPIIKDCPVKYWLMFGDEVHTQVVKSDPRTSLSLEYMQEAQGSEMVVSDVKYLLAWDRNLAAIMDAGGLTPLVYDRMLPSEPWSALAAPLEPAANDHDPLGRDGIFHWLPDEAVEDMGEQRHDFYHQADFSTRGDEHPYVYAYQLDEHYGEENGKLHVGLWGKEASQMVEGLGEDTFFKGTMRWTEHNETGTMLPQQYAALKQFYIDVCGTRRDGTPFDQKWDTTWTRYSYFETTSHDFDTIPFCTWLLDGFNDAYWSQHLDTPGGACHMIQGVQCDGDGYVTHLSVSEMGLDGSMETFLDAMPRLQHIDATYNTIGGSVPQSFIDYNKVSWFNLWHNHLTGSIPCWGDNMIRMDMSYNKLLGTLPACFVDPDLLWLFLEYNHFTGQIPPEWGGLASVSYWWMHYNELTGTLPTEICNTKSLFFLKLEGNKLSGSMPDGCLNNEEGSGWESIRYLYMGHNWLSGSLPVISSARNPDGCFGVGPYGDGRCWLGTYRFEHNNIEGTLDPIRLQGVLQAAAVHDGELHFIFKGNRLYGTLPTMVRDWSVIQGKGDIRYELEDNYLRCEPDGRWPEWVNRRVLPSVHGGAADAIIIDRVSYLSLGKCLPVAHPKMLSPEQWTVGQAGLLAVTGKNFVRRGIQTCRYSSGECFKDTAATRENDNLIRCLVPIDLEPGTYEVTVSNFGEDFASPETLGALQVLPKVTLVAPVVTSNGNAIRADMELGGIDSSSFSAGSFSTAIATLLGISVDKVTVLSAAQARRLQGASRLTVGFVVETIGVSLSSNEIADALNDEASVIQALANTGLIVTSVLTTTSVTRTEVLYDDKTESDGIPIIWILVAAAAAVIGCGLFAFIAFLYYMEKKGVAYFKEGLDEDPSKANQSGGTTIGKPEGV